jgi:LmbE family N-acetylglucosaminyl deacetylase
LIWFLFQHNLQIVNNIILVSAHPDDMEIGMGGTAAKLAQSGANLISIVLTDGRRSPNPMHLAPETMAAIRKQEGERAAKALGLAESIFCDLQDLKSADNCERAQEKLRDLIAETQPSEVYVLHPELDRHQSHRVSGKIAMETVRELSIHCTVWAYEVWGLFPTWDRFEDISSTIGKKIQAIQEHKSQVASIPYAEGVTGLNRWRAIFTDPDESEPGCVFAEVFLRI